MSNGFIKCRAALYSIIVWLQQPLFSQPRTSLLDVVYFVLATFASTGLKTAAFLFEIPIDLTSHPMESFSRLAQRDEHMGYMESYTSHMRRYRFAVAMFISSFAFILIQVTLFGWSLYRIGIPTDVEAVSTNVTLNASWDIGTDETLNYDTDGLDNCVYASTTYSCNSASATSLTIVNQTAPVGCTGSDTQVNTRAALKFSLSTIPNNATITNVELIVNVTNATTNTVTIGRTSSDAPDTLSCTTAGSSLSEAISAASPFMNTGAWNTTGSKTMDLGASADSAVQTRITGSDTIGLGIRIDSGTNNTIITSTDSASNKPQLRVTYTTPPEAPTNASHSANTTTGITWTWTDNASADTSNVIHNASHTVMCTAGAIASTGSTGSCAETSLNANTQYTRHPNAIDAQGNTDGPSMSAYTSIETPTGVSFSSVGQTSVTMTATGTLSHLTSGQSGLYFENVGPLTNSGWTTTNSWTETGLGANQSATYRVKARNGDSDETAVSSNATAYTLAVTPSVTNARTTSTWYTTASFPFTDGAGFGAGGVQYYRYIWDQVASHSFTGTESTWSDNNSNCPGSSCTTLSTTLTRTATSDASNWYLHLLSYNGQDVATDSGTDFGPYYFDGTNPTAIATVADGTGSDATYTTSTTQLSANWTAATDATSGLQKYEYAIGTTSGGTNVLTYTNNSTATAVTKTGLTLTNGTTYYISVRAVDTAGNTGAVTTSNGVTVNTSIPTITDNQTGDAVSRGVSGTTYDIDFAKASAGPQLDYAQYAVYTAAGKTGTLLKDWTNIFTTDTDTYTTNWPVDFSSLQEGTNYVSVRAYALDGLSNVTDDVFTIVKDTTAPVLTAMAAEVTATTATVTWTTNEAASTQAEFGTTSAYGTSSTLDSTMATSHNVDLSGLTADTTYHVRGLSIDAAGNAGSSSDTVFTTSAETIVAPTPTTSAGITTISNVRVIAGETIATFYWTTDEPATSRVDYGVATGYELQSSDTDLVTDHRIQVTGLPRGTTFHYQVTSIGSSTATSADDVFTTSTATSTVNRAIPPTVFAPIMADGARPTMTVTGLGRGGQRINVLIDKKLYRSVVLKGDSDLTVSFAARVDLQSIANGHHEITVQAMDHAGRTSIIRQKISFSVDDTAKSVVQVRRNTTYTVVRGDSLWSIAQDFLGNGQQYQRIIDANPQYFGSGHPTSPTIHPGWQLTIPAART